MNLSFTEFVTLAGELGRVDQSGRFWRRIRAGMWTTHKAEGPGPMAKPEPLPADIAPLSVSIAAACTVAGLGWIIHRRNLLAGTEEASMDWVQAVSEWLSWIFRQLAMLPRRSRTGRRELGTHQAAPKRIAVAIDEHGDLPA